jgi:hypothetical protein
MKFRAEVLLNGQTATGICVPPGVVAGLGSGKRPAVRVTIGSYTYRSTVATMDGVFMLPVSADVRANAGVAAGDVVDVDVEIDTEPRQVTVPPDFEAALDQNDQAKRFFAAQSYSNQRRVVLSIEGAKTDETRRRRIAKSIEMLAAGKA